MENTDMDMNMIVDRKNTWMENGIKKKVKKTNMKFLSQGAYGCVFHPGFTCKGNKQSSKYVTKIEIKKRYIDKELAIGKYIKKKIRLYRTMFAPILTFCEVYLSNIQSDSIQKCDLLSKDDDLIYSTKIRYVGKNSLEPYLFSLLDENNIPFFIKNLFESHIYLTNSISKLIKYKLVHYDIKDNNILYDDQYLLPIIIDFGLSFRIDLLTTEIAYRKAFYVYVPTCTWWCLEIAIISFIVCQEYVHEPESSWMNDKISVDDLLHLVDDYYTNNKCIILIKKKWEKEVNISKKKWKQFIQKECKNKTGKELVEIFMQSWDTWDLYALSFIYLSFMQDLCEDECLTKYQDFLVEYILAVPLMKERKTVKEYYSNLSQFAEEYADLDTLSIDRDNYKENSKQNQLHVSELESIIY